MQTKKGVHSTTRPRGPGAEVLGLDLSGESIAIARGHNPQIEFYVGDMLEGCSHIGKADEGEFTNAY